MALYAGSNLVVNTAGNFIPAQYTTRANLPGPYTTGYSSYFFNGTNNLVSAGYSQLDFGSSDFTIEMWIYPTASGGQILNRAGGPNIAWAEYEILLNGTGLCFAASLSNTGYDIGGENSVGLPGGLIGTVTLNAWNHVAVTRTGNVYRGFLNGSQGWTQTTSGSLYSPGTARGLSIGSNYQTSWTGTTTNILSTFTGYISNLRIVNGTSLYSANFTPSTSPLTAVTNTVLLTCQDYPFVDKSSNNFLFNNNGSTPVSISYTSPFSSPPASPLNTGYLTYVQDQNEFVVNTGVTPPRASQLTTGALAPDYGVTWYKFLVAPMDYKNEVILEQGTVQGGYVGASIYNTIHRINMNTDVVMLTSQTTSFTSKYGGWHSTPLYAYYHQGNNEGTTTQGAAKQDWATFTVTALTNRSALGGTAMNSLHPGPKTQCTVGVLNQGTAGCYITFATDSWTSSGYAISAGTNYGYGTMGANSGYQWNAGYSNVWKLNWSNATWAASSSGNPSNAGSLGKALGTKWEKWFHGSDQDSSHVSCSRYNNASDSWTNAVFNQTNPQVEQCGMMGQDWGYYLGGYGPNGTWNGQNSYSQKIWYASETLIYSAISNGSNSLSSGNGCWGPLP